MQKKNSWSHEDVEILRKLYPDNTAKVVANALGRDAASIYRKAYALKIGKSEAFWKSDASGRAQKGKQDQRIKATQFKKCHATWNKGIPGSTGTHENSRKTQFKKGRRPEESSRYAPIGTLRISKDGYLERKVTDDHPIPSRRWDAVHRIVWEAAHGPIPPGHIVVFKPGQKTAIESEVTSDKLDCITRAENAKRNSVHRFGPEVSRLYQLKGAIARQINRIARNEMADAG